jgi:hypothetical protein
MRKSQDPSACRRKTTAARRVSVFELPSGSSLCNVCFDGVQCDVSHSVMADQLDFPPLPRRPELRKRFSNLGWTRDYLVWRYNNHRFGFEQVGSPSISSALNASRNTLRPSFGSSIRTTPPTAFSVIILHTLTAQTAPIRSSVVPADRITEVLRYDPSQQPAQNGIDSYPSSSGILRLSHFSLNTLTYPEIRDRR